MSIRQDSTNNDEFTGIEVKHSDSELQNRILEEYKANKNITKNRTMMRIERLLDHLLLSRSSVGYTHNRESQ